MFTIRGILPGWGLMKWPRESLLDAALTQLNDSDICGSGNSHRRVVELQSIT